jgi:molecular chaperone GrpE
MESPETAADTDAAPEALLEMRDRWQRALADLENTRKRASRDIAGERARVAAAWLPVLDNLELALQHAQADPVAIVSGVTAVREQALDVLRRLGFAPVDEVGQPFDPRLHEATEVVRTADAPPGTVVAVLRPGFVADDTVLRPAVVAVSAQDEDDGAA